MCNKMNRLRLMVSRPANISNSCWYTDKTSEWSQAVLQVPASKVAVEGVERGDQCADATNRTCSNWKVGRRCDEKVRDTGRMHDRENPRSSLIFGHQLPSIGAGGLINRVTLGCFISMHRSQFLVPKRWLRTSPLTLPQLLFCRIN